jgi:polysaccharide export outer membrane protein
MKNCLRAAALAIGLCGLAVVAAAQEPTKIPETAAMDPNYVIGPQDILDISVWKEPDFTKTVPVRPDGKISLPLINDVLAAGLTPVELGTALATLLRKYVTQPQVTVIVTQINSKRVYVLGEVNHPGPMPLLPGFTLLQALASAGGFSQFANQKQIYLLRMEGGKSKRFPFNYKNAVRGDMKQNIILQSGDTIVVP